MPISSVVTMIPHFWFFFFNDTATTEIYTLSLHDALPIWTRVRVHLGTAEVLARVVQVRSIGPGERGLARLILETPLVARGGDRFVLRSFSPVTTIGGGVVLDPFPAPRPRLRQRRIAADQPPVERLRLLALEAGPARPPGASLSVRLGVLPERVTAVIRAAAGLPTAGDTGAARGGGLAAAPARG